MVIQLAKERRALLGRSCHGRAVAMVESERCRTHQRPGPRPQQRVVCAGYARRDVRGELCRGVERSLNPRPSLLKVAAPVPEPVQCSGQAQFLLHPARTMQPLAGGAQVIVIRLQPVQPPDLLGSTEPRHGSFGEPQKVGRVAGMGDRRFADGSQLLQRVFTDGLQHRDAWLAIGVRKLADQAVFDKRGYICEHVGPLRCAAHHLERFQRRATNKYSEPGEDPPLARAEQVVAPVQRGAQSLLASRQVALVRR